MNNNALNIRHLRVFLAVAECKSISKATERVHLSQPAITQALSKLEAQLETTLFDRKSDGMYLTDTGDVFRQRVQRALQTIIEGLKDALRLGGEKNGTQAAKLLNLMTTTQLRALVAVAAARSFSLAGRNLGISQSSLYRSCRDLESLLGIELLEKTSTGITPSRSALALIRATKIGFSEVDQGREEIHSLHHRDVGHIQIGSMPLARTSVLPSSITEFSRDYPDFRISIADGPYNDLLYQLRHADIDLLIGSLRFPAPSDDIEQEELLSSEVVIVAQPEHPYFKRDDLTLDLMAESFWVVPHPGTPIRTIFENLFTRNDQPVPSRIVESGSQILIRSLLEGSDRMTVVFAHQVQRELDDGVLRVIPFRIEEPNRPIGMTTRKDWKPTRTQQALLAILRRQAQQLEPSEAS